MLNQMCDMIKHILVFYSVNGIDNGHLSRRKSLYLSHTLEHSEILCISHNSLHIPACWEVGVRHNTMPLEQRGWKVLLEGPIVQLGFITYLSAKFIRMKHTTGDHCQKTNKWQERVGDKTKTETKGKTWHVGETITESPLPLIRGSKTMTRRASWCSSWDWQYMGGKSTYSGRDMVGTVTSGNPYGNGSVKGVGGLGMPIARGSAKSSGHVCGHVGEAGWSNYPLI